MHVQSGEWVNEGDLRVVINDDDSMLCRDRMRDELQLALSKDRSPANRSELGVAEAQGDVLLKVADPSDKELLVVFPETERAGYGRVFAEARGLHARLRGGYQVTVKPLQARPRFGDRLPDSAFAGGSSGDIPVIQEAAAEDGFRAAFPVGEAIAGLTPIDSKRLLRGQLSRLHLCGTRTIAERIWIHLGGR